MPKSKVPYLFLAIIVLIMVLTLSAVRETDAPAVKDLRSLDVDSIRTPAESYHAIKTQELQQLPGEEEKSPGRSRKKTGVASLKKEAIENALQPCFNQVAGRNQGFEWTMEEWEVFMEKEPEIRISLIGLIATAEEFATFEERMVLYRTFRDECVGSVK